MDPSYNNSLGSFNAGVNSVGGSVGQTPGNAMPQQPVMPQRPTVPQPISSGSGDIVLQGVEKKKSKKWLVVVILLLLVCAIAGLAAVLIIRDNNQQKLKIPVTYNRYMNYLVYGEDKEDSIDIGNEEIVLETMNSGEYENIATVYRYNYAESDEAKNYYNHLMGILDELDKLVSEEQREMIAYIKIVIQMYIVSISFRNSNIVLMNYMNNKSAEGLMASYGYPFESVEDGDTVLSQWNEEIDLYVDRQLGFLNKLNESGCIVDDELISDTCGDAYLNDFAQVDEISSSLYYISKDMLSSFVFNSVILGEDLGVGNE